MCLNTVSGERLVIEMDQTAVRVRGSRIYCLQLKPGALSLFFFFNDPGPTEIYPLPLHDALPILSACFAVSVMKRSCTTTKAFFDASDAPFKGLAPTTHSTSRSFAASTCSRDRPPSRGITLMSDRKSTRLNSSHSQISYAVFCLKQ